VLGPEEIELLRAFLALHLEAGEPGYHPQLTRDIHRLVLETASSRRTAPPRRHRQ
jgi:hypothetical protein